MCIREFACAWGSIRTSIYCIGWCDVIVIGVGIGVGFVVANMAD